MSHASLMEGQWRILKGVASGAPLIESLNELILLIEKYAPGMLGSVLLLNGDELCFGAAPNLPAAYSKAIDRLRIGPTVGSCGTAAYLKRRVLVEDIELDPLWTPYRQLAKRYGLRASWSTPIFSRDGSVIGTFALYYREPMKPMAEHLALIDEAAQTASIAIQTYRSQRELDESSKRLELAVQASGVGLWDWDIVLNKVVYSAEWKKQIGYEDYEIGNDFSEWENRVHPDDLPAALASVDRNFAGSDSSFESEFRLRHKDGTWRSIYSRGSVFRDATGKPIRMMGGHIDVTEKKQIEARLLSENRFRKAIIDCAKDGLAVCHCIPEPPFVRFSIWNPRMTEITGYSMEEINQKGLYQSLCPNPEIQAKAIERMASLRQGDNLINEEWTIQNAKGEARDVSISTSLVEQDSGSGHVLAIFHDITDRKRSIAEQQRLQLQLNRVQKMESIGTLAGGVAHDFNNMLNIILGYSDLALQLLPRENKARMQIGKIREAAERSANLTKQLLAFARRQPISPVALDLNQTVSGLIDMLRRLIGASVQLEWKPGEDLWPVKFDPAQAEQILTNLCTNARDAIKGSGRILIETQNSGSTKDPTAEGVLKDFVLLRIEDNGSGIPKEHLERIFEPFFTTKELGHGTGLGLATVYGIVRQNAGFISVKSAIGKGTAFEIYLPRAVAVVPVALEQPSPGNSQNGSGIVLVAEDEEDLCELIETVLKDHGYQVLTATTPSKAIELARRNGRLDVLLTDMVMPEMGGLELANEITKIHPSVKKIFMSGYTTDVVMLDQLAERRLPFIHKPFSIHALTAKVSEALVQAEEARQ